MEAIYKEMYLTLFDAVAVAIEELNQMPIVTPQITTMRNLLIKSHKAAEEMYINAEQEDK